jgi:hypothetical protein
VSICFPEPNVGEGIVDWEDAIGGTTHGWVGDDPRVHPAKMRERRKNKIYLYIEMIVRRWACDIIGRFFFCANFAFSLAFGYNISMKKSLFATILIFCISLPFSLFAWEGFIGEDPGFDFYSKIDEWQFTVQKKIIDTRLKQNPTMNQFGKKCIQAESLLKNIPTTSAMLDDIENGNYALFTEKLLENIKSNPNAWDSISTDTFQSLTQCIATEYKNLKRDTRKEIDARTTISYLGLYMDGDKNNSDYDIISDIEKINMIVFSQDLKYSGTPNQAGKWLSNFISGKAVAPLFALAGSSDSMSNPPSQASGAPSTDSTTQNSGITEGLSTLLGGSCKSTAPVGPVSSIVDDAFIADLSSVLASGGWVWSLGVWASALIDPRGAPGSASQAWAGLTSAGDFFQNIPCSSIFCIKIKMIPGGTIWLGGGKNISIEGILDANTKILMPIANSSLDYQVMTNNAWSDTRKWLKLINILSWLKVYIAEKPQITRRDKKEVTPSREAEELAGIKRCGYASAWLSPDLARSRSIGWAGYNTTIWRSSENVRNTTIPLGPQEAWELARFTWCISSYMQDGRKSYYDSFSTDVTEIQAYTASMLSEIDKIISILTEMKSKPVR